MFTNHMQEKAGQIVTIKKVFDECYRIEEFGYYWTDEMLEDIKESVNTSDLGSIFLKTVGQIFSQKDEQIEKLRTELKEANSTIDFLNGQLSVYKDLNKEEK